MSGHQSGHHRPNAELKNIMFNLKEDLREVLGVLRDCKTNISNSSALTPSQQLQALDVANATNFAVDAQNGVNSRNVVSLMQLWVLCVTDLARLQGITNSAPLLARLNKRVADKLSEQKVKAIATPPRRASGRRASAVRTELSDDPTQTIRLFHRLDMPVNLPRQLLRAVLRLTCSSSSSSSSVGGGGGSIAELKASYQAKEDKYSAMLTDSMQKEAKLKLRLAEATRKLSAIEVAREEHDEALLRKEQALDAQKAALDARLNHATSELEAFRGKSMGLQGQVVALQAELSRLQHTQHALTSAEERNIALEGQLASAKKEADAARALRVRVVSFEAHVASRDASIATLQHTQEELKAALAASTREFAQLRSQTDADEARVAAKHSKTISEMQASILVVHAAAEKSEAQCTVLAAKLKESERCLEEAEHTKEQSDAEVCMGVCVCIACMMLYYI
jgi:hypothetical protein